MRLEVETKELKSAIQAIEAIAKKVPSEIASGDAAMAIIRKNDGYHLVSVTGYFTADVALKTMIPVGEDEITLWEDGGNNMMEAALGILDSSQLGSLLAKLKNKTTSLAVSDDQHKMTLSASQGQTYDIKLAAAKKVVASYAPTQFGDRLVKLDSNQFNWFCTTLSSLSKIVKEEVTKPGFGCVCLCAFPSKSGTVQLSANSLMNGYSFICDSQFTAYCDFKALLPKNLSEAFGAFISKLGSSGSNVEISGTLNDDRTSPNDKEDRKDRIGALTFKADTFLLSITCVRDDFPFSSLAANVASVRKPYCSYSTKKGEIKGTIDRLALFANDDDSVTEISILDGGTMEFIQRRSITSNEKPARETCNEGIITDFPDNIPSLGTSVKTNVVKSLIGLMPSTDELVCTVCETVGSRPRRFALLGNDDYSAITAVLLGLRR